MPDNCVRISTKVDVWSLGVLFYVMLYGKLPIGHNLNAEEFVTQHVMLHPTEVHCTHIVATIMTVSDCI